MRQVLRGRRFKDCLRDADEFHVQSGALSQHSAACIGNNRLHGASRHCGRRAFTLIEVMLSMVIISVLFVGVYGAIASSVSIVRICQENERVTQILSEKTDMIRVYNWQQLTNRFIPTNFVERLDPLNSNSMAFYTGSIAIARAPIAENYRTNLMQVTVEVKWLSGKRPQTRSMTTYVAKYGLQSYILE